MSTIGTIYQQRIIARGQLVKAHRLMTPETVRPGMLPTQNELDNIRKHVADFRNANSKLTRMLRNPSSARTLN
jgi:hypothetical protein